VRQTKAASEAELIDLVVRERRAEGMYLAVTITSMRKKQLTEKVVKSESRFCCAIACSPKQCHIFVFATMQKMIRCKEAASLLQQLQGECQALGLPLPGSELLPSQPRSMSAISLTI